MEAEALTPDQEIVKTVGSSGQISLGKKLAGRKFIVQRQKNGAFLLKPAVTVAVDDAWLYKPEMRRKLAMADAWMSKNPPSETDVDELEAKLRGLSA